MVINDFQFPGVELTQEFVETPVTGVSQLGVVVIGQQYKVSDVPAVTVTAGAATVITLPESEGVIDNTSDISQIIVRDGLYPTFTATSASTGLRLSSGTIATDRKTAELTFNARISDGTVSTTAFGECQPTVGGTVDVITSGNTNGVPSIIESISGVKMTVSPSDGRYTEGDTITGVKFYATFDAKYTPTAQTSNTMTLAADPTTKIPGTNTNATLVAGDYVMALKYSNLDEELQPTRKLGIVGSKAEIEKIFGTPCVENPVALALLFALYAGQTNRVYYMLTAADTGDDYVDALDILAKNNAVYSIVPVTDNYEAISDLIGAVERLANNPESKTRNTVWYGVDTNATNVAEGVIGVVDTVGHSYRAQAVWADDVLFNGQIVPNYIVAAAPAGMRSYEPTYRPISNLGYNFFTVKDTHELTKTALLSMGEKGVWLIDNNYDGTPINLRQITTAVSNNINKDEESIVANADSIALTLCRVGEDLVGCSNISPDLLVALHDTLTGIMDRYLLNLTGNVYIGPQLLSYSIDRLEQDPVQLDHIYATITCEPPKPFNRFVMTLRIV